MSKKVKIKFFINNLKGGKCVVFRVFYYCKVLVITVAIIKKT